VLTYKLIEAFNLFDYNTEGMINMRAAHKVDDQQHKLARASVGMVEGKLLQMKVRGAAACLFAILLLVPGPRAIAAARASPPAPAPPPPAPPGGQRPPLHRQDGPIWPRPQHPGAPVPGHGAHRRPGAHLRRPRRRRRCAP
jgi:hypothetical protein